MDTDGGGIGVVGVTLKLEGGVAARERGKNRRWTADGRGYVEGRFGCLIVLCGDCACKAQRFYIPCRVPCVSTPPRESVFQMVTNWK